MFSRVTHQAKAMVQHASVAALARPVSFTATRLPAASHLPSAQTLRLAATVTSSQYLLSGALGLGVARDWPEPEDGWDGQRLISPEGLRARQAALARPLSGEMVRAYRQWHAYKTGQGVSPDLSSRMIRIDMAQAIERPLGCALAGYGQGVVVGLRELKIGPGDSVAEQEYAFPTLGVRLAADGARVFLTHSNPERTRMVSEELARYRDGRTFPSVKKGEDGTMLPSTVDHQDTARLVSRQLVASTGSAFDALPQGVGFKALISRGAFDVMDARAVDASIRQAGRLLQPGAGLVFEFFHKASMPVRTEVDVPLCSIGFHDIEAAVKESGLSLRLLYINSRFAGKNGDGLMIDRCVQPETGGRIPLRKADAAAWSVWDEVSRRSDLHGRPLNVFVSGLFVKQGKAGD